MEWPLTAGSPRPSVSSKKLELFLDMIHPKKEEEMVPSRAV